MTALWWWSCHPDAVDLAMIGAAEDPQEHLIAGQAGNVQVPLRKTQHLLVPPRASTWRESLSLFLFGPAGLGAR